MGKSVTEKQEKILSMQCESTRRAMLRSPAEDEAWRSRPIPKEAQVLDKNGNVDLGVRHISVEEYELHEKMRRGRGEIFESVRKDYLVNMAAAGKINMEKFGHYFDTPHVLPDSEKRDRAIAGFMGTLKSIAQKFKDFMGTIFEPSYAEKVADSMRQSKKELHK